MPLHCLFTLQLNTDIIVADCNMFHPAVQSPEGTQAALTLSGKRVMRMVLVFMGLLRSIFLHDQFMIT